VVPHARSPFASTTTIPVTTTARMRKAGTARTRHVARGLLLGQPEAVRVRGITLLCKVYRHDDGPKVYRHHDVRVPGLIWVPGTPQHHQNGARPEPKGTHRWYRGYAHAHPGSQAGGARHRRTETAPTTVPGATPPTSRAGSAPCSPAGPYSNWAGIWPTASWRSPAIHCIRMSGPLADGEHGSVVTARAVPPPKVYPTREV
jgi:hypothetical protein